MRFVRERERSARRETKDGAVKKTDAFQSSPLRKKKKRKREREREREREMQNRPLSPIGWKKIDLSLFSLFSLSLPSFLPCFSSFGAFCLSHRGEEREKKRVLLFGSFRFENNERTVTI